MPMNYSVAKQIMGNNFIGYEELSDFSDKLNLLIENKDNEEISNIPFSRKYLKSVSKTHILILFIPLNKQSEFVTLNSLRSYFGINPDKNEPCFYNQDWYLKESFANFSLKKEQWFCIRKELIPETRGKIFAEINNLPLALICAYTFFASYVIKNEYLWKNDFVWCKDSDSNGDRIYVGRYYDPNGIAKNGFSIHRHLTINNNYGSI